MKKYFILLTLITLCSYAQDVTRRDIYGIADKHYVELKKGNFTSILDDDEEIVIPFERGYNYVYLRSELQFHMFLVLKDSKYGICDENGFEVLPPIFRSIRQCRTGGGHPYLIGEMKKHEYYIYDIKGNKLLSDALKDYPYYDPEPGKGFYTLGSHYKRKYIDFVIETPEEYNLMARTREYTFIDGVQIVWYHLERGRAHGILDEKGDTIISPSRGYTKITYRGIGAKYDYFEVEKGYGKKGICLRDGTELIPAQFETLVHRETIGGHDYIDAHNPDEHYVFDLYGNIVLSSKYYIKSETVSAMLDTPSEREEGMRREAEKQRVEEQQTDNIGATFTPPILTFNLNDFNEPSNNEIANTTKNNQPVEREKVKQVDYVSFKTLDRAYSGYEDYLVKMRFYPEKFESSDFERVPNIQKTMREIREKIEKLGFKRGKSSYETWIPEYRK